MSENIRRPKMSIGSLPDLDKILLLCGKSLIYKKSEFLVVNSNRYIGLPIRLVKLARACNVQNIRMFD